jgi:hypothetical protein
MSFNQIREDITAAVEAAKVGFTAYPLIIEYDNKIVVDTAAQVNPFLQVRMKLIDGYQMELASNPHHRIIGQIELAAVIKDGKGTAQAYALLDHFYPKLHRKSLGSVRTLMALPAPTKKHMGWNYYPVLIPLWSDQLPP